MKKVILFLGMMLCAAMTFAQSYGILVNGTTYFAGTKVGESKIGRASCRERV